MAPSSGYHMVPKAIRAVKYAISRSSDFVRARLASGSKPSLEAVPILVRGASHAIHPAAVLRQSRARLASRQTRLFSTAIEQLGRLTAQIAPKTARSAFPASATRAALNRSTFAPFSSPLRPNLTGGTLSRTAGGYGLGGGGFGAARHFSHTGSAQAHVVQNVNAAVRAFFLQGGRPLYDGTDPRTGNMRFRAVGCAEATAHKTLNAHKRTNPWEEIRGTSIDFHIAPTVTALSTVEGPATLKGPAVLTGLASDFARQLRELSAVYADLNKLRTLGALPVSQPDATILRVRFDGCDAATVLALCDELGVTRGIVKEDPGWDYDPDAESDGSVSPNSHTELRHDRDVEMALLFPWAPTERCPSKSSAYDETAGMEGGRQFYFTRPPTQRKDRIDTALEWRSMLSSGSPSQPLHSPDVPPSSFALIEDGESSEAFESVAASSDIEHHHRHYNQGYGPSYAPVTVSTMPRATGYEGVEGIYRFLRELESADRRI